MTRRPALFATVLAAIVTARLALHGHTYTRIGSAGIEIPQVASVEGREATDRIVDLEATVAQMKGLVAALGARIATLEDPPHSLLNADREETYDADHDPAQ